MEKIGVDRIIIRHDIFDKYKVSKERFEELAERIKKGGFTKVSIKPYRPYIPWDQKLYSLF